MTDEPIIGGVSDTARWVAAYRAQESARRKPLFRDPLAAKLAGPKGAAIAHRAPTQAAGSVIARTKIIDEIIEQALREGCDRVLNLAAGLDTRPYRLDLARDLRWIEADFRPLIEEKERILAGETPRCALERIAVDLTDADARAQFLDSALHGARRALVLTEGLLAYLDEASVRALAGALHGRAEIATWVLDLFSPAIVAATNKRMERELAGAPWTFAPPNGVAYFEALGWSVVDTRSVLREAIRLRRMPFYLRPLALLPPPDPRALGGSYWFGVVSLSAR